MEQFIKMPKSTCARLCTVIVLLIPTLSFVSGSNDDACGSSRPEDTTGSSGDIWSPNYPYYYYSNSFCEWKIQSSETGSNAKVTLDFDYFYTEVGRDFVTLFDGSSTSASIMSTISGSFSKAPRGFTTTQRYMYVRFLSDGSINFKGFYATYRSTTQFSVASRLSGASSLYYEGRYEVLYNNGSGWSWGWVCDDEFEDVDTRVACNGLGYGFTGWFLGNKYGADGNLPQWLSGLECTGNEPSIAQCPHDGWGTSRCSISEAVSIACATSSALSWWAITLIVCGSIALFCILLGLIWVLCNKKNKSRRNSTVGAPGATPEPQVVYTTSSPQANDVYAMPAPPAYGSQCIVCRRQPCNDVAAIPCGHAAFCADCASNLASLKANCPICQQPIVGTVGSSARY